MTIMAPPWWRWFGQAPQSGEDEERRKAEDERRHKLRHDYAGALGMLSLKTEEVRQAMDAIDVQLDYLRATGRNWRADDAEPKGDAAGGGVRGGDPGDV